MVCLIPGTTVRLNARTGPCGLLDRLRSLTHDDCPPPPARDMDMWHVLLQIVTEILDRPDLADAAAMEETSGQAEGKSRPAGAQEAPEDAGNNAGSTGESGAGGPDDGGAVAATTVTAAAEAAGPAAGTPVARRKSSAQQQTLSPMLEQAVATDVDVQVEARIGGEEEGERRRSASSSVSFPGVAAGEWGRGRAVRQSTLEIPRPSAPSEVATHVRGGGSGVEAVGGASAYGSREERGDERKIDVSKSRSTDDLEAPSGGRDGILKRNGVSALNLRDGGFAPGEEGCGRDEEL